MSHRPASRFRILTAAARKLPLILLRVMMISGDENPGSS
jgi:hypothetical protein